MLHERLRSVQATLHITNTDIARCAGCTPSNISRLRSGSRTPPPDSPTIRRLAQGIYACARETGQLVTLSALCALPAGEDEACEALAAWLTGPPRKNEPQRSYGSFGSKLGELMRLAGATGSRLSRLTGLDSSLISRYRRGRQVRCSPTVLERICGALIGDIRQRKNMPRLAGLLQISEEMLGEEDAVHIVCDWLCGVSAPVSRIALENLLDSITEYSETILEEQDVPEDWCDILRDEQKRYVGYDGLRRAMMRLLATALEEAPEEIWLYSDAVSVWLEGDYLAQWERMMHRIVRRGIRIRILHNIDREMPGMVAGIRRWLPMYMTGYVKPFYSLRYGGERFSHVMFLIPGRAAVTACCVCGMEDACTYHFMTDTADVGRVQEAMEHLFARSRPLIRVLDHADDPGYVTKQKIRICLGENSVTVSRTQAPHFSCEFLHPMLYRAFREYVMQRLQEDARRLETETP